MLENRRMSSPARGSRYPPETRFTGFTFPLDPSEAFYLTTDGLSTRSATPAGAPSASGVWRDAFGASPPYPVDDDTLFVAGLAEVGAHSRLVHRIPQSHQQAVTARGRLDRRPNLYGLDTVYASEKEQMRSVILRGGNWSGQERLAILNYCESDVDALARLLSAMFEHIDLLRALLRGR
jgi:hypothetical protein